MEPVTIGIFAFVLMIVMILLGFPVFVSLMSTTFLGFYLIAGPNMAFSQFTTGIFSLGATYKFAVLPLFMLMGVLTGETGIAGGAFDAARKWTGRLRGGLMMGTIGANLIFGACSGMSVAANAVFGKVAFPQLKKNGYNESLALGCIAATGALSSLIPPSLAIIMFCILTDLSIGTALTTSISPGLITAVFYCIIVIIIGKTRPGMVPEVSEADRNVTLKEKMGTMKLLLPIIGLFAIIIGGSFFGWFAATVAGAIGAFAVIVYGFFSGNSIKKLSLNVVEAVKMNAQVFPMIIGGMMFSRLITLSGLAEAFASSITGADMNKYALMLVLIVFYLIMGCIMDIMSIMIITVPIVYPVLKALGYDPYVVCVMLVFLCEIGGLTPPIGMNVFATATVLRIDPGVVFKGVWPFFVIDIIMIFVLIFFPGVATWLPDMLS